MVSVPASATLDRVLAVRRDALLDVLPSAGFVGLPEEEAERLLGAIEVCSVTRAELANDSTWQPLVTYTAVHYNYSWFSYELTAAEKPSERRLGLCAALAASDELLFLDPRIEPRVRGTLERQLCFVGGYHLRLAGVLHSVPDARGAPPGLMYVAKLRQPGVTSQDARLQAVRNLGNGQLREERATFDAWSRALIDNLHAL